MSRAFQLIPGVQSYDWGKLGADKECLVANFAEATEQLRFERANDSPYAELWMGTHPNVPSRLAESGELLQTYLEAHPELLGAHVPVIAGQENPYALPFLFKVLSINKALSIQAHPNKRLAEQLHAQRPAMYKDANHKPEMTVALTAFEGFCGFRPLPEIINFVRVVPEWRELLLGADEGVEKALESADSDDKVRAALHRLFAAFMRTPEHTHQDVVARLAARYAGAGPHEVSDEIAALVVRLDKQFPRDIGVLCTFVLNIVHLQPGEAMFLYPDELHAYISGNILECMAASDNVVRAGLTPKARDVDVLVDMLTYRSGDAASQRLRVVPWPEAPNTLLYNPPIEEFSVLTTRVDASGEVKHPALRGPSIVIVLSGRGTLAADGKGMPLSPGLVYFIGAATEATFVGTEALEIGRAFAEPRK